jgi:hypothetical protein
MNKKIDAIKSSNKRLIAITLLMILVPVVYLSFAIFSILSWHAALPTALLWFIAFFMRRTDIKKRQTQ